MRPYREFYGSDARRTPAAAVGGTRADQTAAITGNFEPGRASETGASALGIWERRSVPWAARRGRLRQHRRDRVSPARLARSMADDSWRERRQPTVDPAARDRKSTRLNSSHLGIS